MKGFTENINFGGLIAFIWFYISNIDKVYFMYLMISHLHTRKYIIGNMFEKSLKLLGEKTINIFFKYNFPGNQAF